MANSELPLSQSGSDATDDRLRVTHQKATERQTATMLWLIVVMTVLTILMAAVPTVVRIWSWIS